MKILLCHSYYIQRGGEDRSFEEERELLVAAGHDVIEYVRNNDELQDMGAMATASKTLWNRRAAADMAELVRHERPEVVHCTNTFPLISPAVCHVAHRGGAAVVYALRNYRLLCASPYLMRDSRPCEDCLGRAIPWPAIAHRCYRDSAVASAAVAAMQVLHRTLGTWRRKVDAFFTLTEFARQKFVQAGFAPESVHVKHNSVQPDPGRGDGAGGYVAFAGRLSPEKGLTTLLEAWRQDATLPPLKIVGDGPLYSQAQVAAASDSRIEALGRLSEPEVHRIFGRAMAVVVPSLWYETFGRTVAEAFAGGTPVIASRLGALAELVEHGRTGWHFAAGNAADLAAAVRGVAHLPGGAMAGFRARARTEYEQRFTPQRNYARLMEIYEIALQHSAQRRSRVAGLAAGAIEKRTVREAALSGVVA
jgi:glycosyltransferase involved in cell wall biosynthesis